MTASFDDLVHLIRTARGLEAGGYYGLSKLLWALVYAEEIKASNAAGIPRGADLDKELGLIADSLKASGASEAILSALDKGRQAVRDDRTVSYEDVPAVYASRTTGEIFLGDPPEFTDNNDHRLALRQFASIWYFEPMSPQEALVALEAGPNTIEAAVQGLSTEQFQIAPAPGEWNMRELLGHLMMAQDLLAERVDLMLNHDNPLLEGKAVWAMADRETLSPGELLERFHVSREQLVTRLKAISLNDWWRGGWHSEFGQQTVLSQSTYFARHEMSHMPQAAQIRRGVGV
ncbi:MAG: DinB family protein [Anaerolineae bacterium]|nr:DinB family protein [Anaerolineae bacterium]